LTFTAWVDLLNAGDSIRRENIAIPLQTWVYECSSVQWSPFVRRFVYNKLEVKFMHTTTDNNCIIFTYRRWQRLSLINLKVKHMGYGSQTRDSRLSLAQTPVKVSYKLLSQYTKIVSKSDKA
jgi:hypothetical protein